MTIADVTPEALAQANADLEAASPREILAWTFEHWGDGAAIGTGFGPSGVVLLHLAAELRPETTVFYLDTDLLFPETLALRDRLAEAFGIRFTRVHSGLNLYEQAIRHGMNLWERNPDRCCFLRKVEPLRRYLAGKDAWITGLRRDQSRSRAQAPIATWDRTHNVVKVNPLATWTEEMVWSYIDLYDLPYNELHDQGYPSLGCLPCTRPVAPGEDLRAGRWSGHAKTECGIHEVRIAE